MIAGIDTGYYKTKEIVQDSAGGIKKIAFTSVSGRYRKSNFSLNGHQDIVLNDEDGQWIIGEGATGQTRFIQRREDGRWYQSSAYRRLMLAAFGQATSGTAVKMQIVTGLPVAYYRAGKEELEAIFLGQHRVALAGRPAQRIEVQTCRVIPQPFGAIFALAMNDAGRVVNKSLVKGPTAVIDIGGKTTNLLRVIDLKDDSARTTSINTGGWDIVRDIGDFLTATYPDMALSEAQIMEAVTERRIWYHDQFVDISAAVAEITAEMANVIHSKATQLWNGGGDLRHLLITGGGAYLIGQSLKTYFPQAAIAPDAQFANALGYWKFANFLAAHS